MTMPSLGFTWVEPTPRVGVKVTVGVGVRVAVGVIVSVAVGGIGVIVAVSVAVRVGSEADQTLHPTIRKNEVKMIMRNDILFFSILVHSLYFFH
jgi:hypothetical protein